MERRTYFEESIKRWQAFWQHSVSDRPPLVLRTYQNSAAIDDTIPQIDGRSGLAVTGWMFGAKVKTIAGISWVEPVLDRIQDWQTIDFDAVRERANIILESYGNLVEDSQGRYAISPGVLEAEVHPKKRGDKLTSNQAITVVYSYLMSFFLVTTGISLCVKAKGR